MRDVGGADNTSEVESFEGPLQELHFLLFLKLDKDTRRAQKQILTFPDRNSFYKSRDRNLKGGLSCQRSFY